MMYLGLPRRPHEAGQEPWVKNTVVNLEANGSESASGGNDVGSLQVTAEPSNLFTVRSDGSKLSQITDYGPGKERAIQPTWTADGRIVFDHITGADDERGTVAFVNSDGSGLEIALGNEFIGEGNRPHPRLRPVR